MKYLAAVAFLAFGALVALVPTVSAQSLGQVAKREAARRRAVDTHGKVYTNESLDVEPRRDAPGDDATDSVADSAAAAVDARQVAPADAATDADALPDTASALVDQQPDDETNQSRKGEAYWKARIQTEREGLTRSQTLVDALQSRINALSADFTARDDPAQRNVIAADRQNALAELARMKQQIQQHTKALADIKEEARRAGVPAGWVR